MIDIHCHIIHGVDDGSRSITESIGMLRAAKNSGIDHIVCTPHCRWGDFDPALIRRNYLQLREHACQYGIRLDLGYEVYWTKLMEMGIEKAPELCFEGTNTLLLEFSTLNMPSNWQGIIYKLQGMGMDIIIAHPERYHAIQKDINIAYELHDMGCALQLSADFIKGGFRNAKKDTAKKLLKAGAVSYIASDAHRIEHYEFYREAVNAGKRQTKPILP